MEKEREPLTAESTCCVKLIQMTFGLSILVKDLKPHTLAQWAEMERITTVEPSLHTVLVTFLIDETRQKQLQGGRSLSCSRFSHGVRGGTRQFPTPRQMMKQGSGRNARLSYNQQHPPRLPSLLCDPARTQVPEFP